jgi:hypothetical protein
MAAMKVENSPASMATSSTDFGGSVVVVVVARVVVVVGAAVVVVGGSVVVVDAGSVTLTVNDAEPPPASKMLTLYVPGAAELKTFTVSVPQAAGMVALIGPLALAVHPPVSLVTVALSVFAVPDWAVPPDGDTDVIVAPAGGATNASVTRISSRAPAMRLHA